MVGLGWLVFGVAMYRGGMMDLPNGESGRVSVLRDTEGRLDFDAVMAASAEAWRPGQEAGYQVVDGGGALWLKITLMNPGETPWHGVLADSGYLTDRVEAWTRDAAGGWQMARTGEAMAGRDRSLWGRSAAFPVSVPAGDETTVFLRASDRYDAYVWLRWWPRVEDFFQTQLRETLTEAICYGGLAALLIYNLVLWLRLRFPDMGCYVLYAAALGVFNFFANGGPALLGLGIGSPTKESVTGGALALSGVFLAQFARMFLGTGTLMPAVDRWLRWARFGLLGLAPLGAVAAPFWFTVIVVSVTVLHVALLGVAAEAWRRGVGHARFFIGAFGLLFAGALPAVIAWLRQDMQAWAAMALLAGCVLEMSLLSFAVADRFAQTQRRLVEETERRRVIQEAYADELEVEVRERTRELVEANADKDRMISVIGHDLRSPLTGIAGMAEQLTRDSSASSEDKTRFIAETGHVGRQALLLIEDLVLWARLRAGTTHMGMHSLAALVAPVVELYRAEAGRRGVRLDAGGVGENWRVSTDLVLAQTLVRNLVANASRYAVSRVKIAAVAASSGKVRLTVGDDGPGLPAEVAARLASGAERVTDTNHGLGLRLCVEISRALEVEFTTESAAGGGTVFALTFETADEVEGVCK